MGTYFAAVLLADSADGVPRIAGRLAPSSGAKLMEHSWMDDKVVQTVERALTTPQRVVWAADSADDETGTSTNLYTLAKQSAELKVDDAIPVGRYLINHDKQTYVDKTTVAANKHGDVIHPLPILTVEGYGPADLRWDAVDGEVTLAGTWARDRITVSDTVPDDYQQLQFDLVLNW